eukprot:sb/3473451/
MCPRKVAGSGITAHVWTFERRFSVEKTCSNPEHSPNPSPNPTFALTLKNRLSALKKHPDFNAGPSCGMILDVRKKLIWGRSAEQGWQTLLALRMRGLQRIPTFFFENSLTPTPYEELIAMSPIHIGFDHLPPVLGLVIDKFKITQFYNKY